MRLFLRVIEPAGADGHIHLRRAEAQAAREHDVRQRAQIGHGVVDAIERNIAVQGRGAGLHLRAARQLARHDGPLGKARCAAFVANPAHVRPAIVKDHGIGLVFAHELDIAGKIVFLLFAVRPLAARAIEPHDEHIAIFGEQLGELRLIIIVVFRGAIERAVAIPGRKIKAKFQPRAAARFRHFAHHIALAVPPGAIFHAVFRILGRP